MIAMAIVWQDGTATYKNKHNKIITTPVKTFNKYKQNLRQIGDDIWSYSTKVATIEDNKLKQLGYWSVTTQKHINYAAAELGLELNRNGF